MPDLWVFDFDGTLVQTAALKRKAFFDVFPERHADTVAAVLTQWPDASRNDVIPRIVAAANNPVLDAAAMVEAYTAQVTDQVLQAPAIAGVEAALEVAAGNGVACVFSMTPHAELVNALQMRGWDRWLSDMRGFPARKSDTLAEWISRFGASRVTVIGDGQSDADAARLNGAHFLRADTGWPMRLTQSVLP